MRYMRSLKEKTVIVIVTILAFVLSSKLYLYRCGTSKSQKLLNGLSRLTATDGDSKHTSELVTVAGTDYSEMSVVMNNSIPSPPVVPPYTVTNTNNNRFVLLMGYSKSGATLAGDIFRKMMKAAYFYDPIEGIYTHLYGLKFGQLHTSDIFHYQNGSARVLPQLEEELLLEQLSSIFNCKFSDIVEEFLMTKKWLTGGNGIGLRHYLACFYKSKLWIERCLKLIQNVCPHRLIDDDSQQKKCHLALKDLNHGNISNTISRNNLEMVQVVDSLLDYVDCRRDGRQKINSSCIQFLEDDCNDCPLRVIKTSRLHMTLAQRLVRSKPTQTKIIYVTRDPRTAVFDRIATPETLHRRSDAGFLDVLFDGTPEMIGQEMDDVRESLSFEIRLYCESLRKDLGLIQQIEKDAPGSTFLIILEQLHKYPQTIVQELHKFLNIAVIDGYSQLYIQQLSKDSDTYIVNRHKLLHKIKLYGYETFFQENCQDLLTFMQPYFS